MSQDRFDISEDTSRRALLGLLLPAAAGLILPARLVVRARDGLLTAIPYADLPTGAGSWNTGGGLITVANAMTVSGLLTASGNLTAIGKMYVGGNNSVGSDSTLVAVSNGSTSDLYVMRALPGFPSTTTGTGSCFNAQVGTAASAFTMASGVGLLIFDAAKGAGSSITTLYGLYIANQSQGGTNYAIYTNSGQVRFGDVVNVSGLLTASAGATVAGGALAARNLTLDYSSSSFDGLIFTDTAGSGKSFRLGSGTGGAGQFGLYDGSNAKMLFYALANQAGARFYSSLQVDGLLTASAKLAVSDASLSQLEFQIGGTRKCGWKTSAADVLNWYDNAGNTRLVVKYADGHPLIGLDTEDAQLAVGDPTNGGYVLLNGTNNGGGEAGDVLITGRSGGSAGVGDVKIRTSADGSSATDLATFKANGTLNVGAPSGGISGAGKINVAGDIYKNGTGYTNPDYVFELAYEGAVRSPAPIGYAFGTLDEIERFTREHLHLPGISREASGMFARADMLLEKVEELYLHAFAQQRQNLAQQREIQSLRARVQHLEGHRRTVTAGH